MRGSQPSLRSGAIKPLPDGAEREWFLFQLLVIRSELRSQASGQSTDLPAASLTFIQYPVVKDQPSVPVGSASPNRLSDPSCCRVPFRG